MRQTGLPGAKPPDVEIVRPRLDALLEEAVQYPLAVAHAGAGFGKTQAAAQFLAGTDYRAVFVTLTPLDNIPSRFWENFTRVSHLHKPALAEKMKQQGFPETLQAFDTFLTEFTAELYADNHFVVFVFDNVHIVTEPLVQAFLGNLISARLENNCVLLLTRQWPLWEIEATLPSRIIGAEELRFTLEETAALFAAAGLHISEGDIAGIHHYTSGWPIALSLVALHLQRGGDPAPGRAALLDTKPRLFSLFEEEIFSQYTPPEQRLLVQLSVLESFPRGLVQAVSGEKGRDLGQLLGGNIFIQYDAGDRRFYFHPLYHEFLREKLLLLEPGDVDGAYRKAADWCRAQGYYFDAVSYYKQCGATEEIWETLLLFSANRHTRSEAEFLIAQIEAMPDGFRRENPMTDIVLSVLLVNNLAFEKSLQVLDAVQGRLEAAKEGADPLLLGECHTARGLIALAMEQNGFEAKFRRAAELLPGGSRRWGSSLRLVDMGPGINLQSAKAGELKKSLACFTEGVPYMVQVLHGAGTGLDKLCESEVKFLAGEAREAAEPAYKALYSARDAGQYDIVGNALFMLLRIFAVTGDYKNLEDTIEQVGRYAGEEQAEMLGIWDVARGWFYAEMGDVGRVAGWIRLGSQNSHPPLSMDRAFLVQIRCLIASDKEAEALALIDQMEGLAKQKSAIITLLYVELGRAVTHNALGNYGPAMAALKAAYQLARGNRLYMPFIEYGNRTRSLLDRARKTPGHGIPAAWLEEMYTKASTYAKRHAYLTTRYRQEREGHTTGYGLSKRELEVLGHLAQGLTREEIGESAGLSLNTVKSILKQVFAKLGAINSADAIRIAVAARLI